MSRRQKGSLRELTLEERAQLEQISRAHAMPVSHVAGTKVLLTVATSIALRLPLTKRVGDPAMRVARFNREGMAALFPLKGGGHPARYTVADRERILAEARRVPDRERDGTPQGSAAFHKLLSAASTLAWMPPNPPLLMINT